MKTLVPSVLIALLAGLAIGFLLTPKKDNFYKDQLKQKDLRYGHAIDSLNKLYTLAMEAVRVAHVQTQLANAEKEKAHRATQLILKKHEAIKNAPIVRYTDAELDSLLSAWYPR